MSSEKFETDDGKLPGANTTRRKLMAAGAASWATVGLAGCSGNGDTTTEEPGTTASPQPSDLVVTEDMVTGSDGIPATAGFVSACAPTRTFSPGMHAIWDVGIYEPDSGEVADPELVESVQISMSSSDVSAADGETVEITWAGDDEENPHQYWNGAWTIPEDVATGTVEYEVEVSTTGPETNLVGVAGNSFDIIEFQDNWVISSYTYAVSGGPDSTGGFVSSCSPEWQFAPGMKVVINANIFDPTAKGTEDPDDPSVAGDDPREPGPENFESVTLSFPNDEFEDMEMEWLGDAEEHAERVWETVVQLADDQEPGVYKYEITAETAEGAAENVIDVNSAVSEFTVVDI